MTGPFKTTSSLFKSAKSAANKIQQIEDSQQKFLWDTNQITNDDYLGYAQKRLDDSTDTMDKISWGRSVISVNKEIDRDYRAEKMLEIARTPGNSSNDYYTKLTMLEDLYNRAASYGDQDGMLSIETQYYNTIQAYQNKLESEAKAGNARAQRALTASYNEQKNMIDMARLDIKKQVASGNITEVEEIALNTDLDSKEMQLALSRAASTDNENTQANELEKYTKLQMKVQDNMQIFDGKATDQFGKEFTGADGQILSGFETAKGQNVYGKPVIQFRKDENGNDLYAKFWDGQKMKIIEKGTGNVIDIAFQDGMPTYVKGNDKLNPNDSAEMLDTDGTVYYTKINKDSYPEQDQYNGDGTIADPSSEKTPKMATTTDRYGTVWRYNPNTGKFNSIDASAEMTKNYNLLSEAEGIREGSIKSRGVIAGNMGLKNVADMKKTAFEAIEKRTLEESLLASSKLAEINKATKGGYQYDPGTSTLKATNGPLRVLPAPAQVKQNFQNVLSPTGQFGFLTGSGGKDILGTKDGVDYWRAQRADGGYDVFKGNNFKLSKADAEKELGKGLGSW